MASVDLNWRLTKLSQMITWSTLAKIGSTPAMRLTILIPLIGFFLLFNQYTEQFLSWPNFLKHDLGPHSISPRNLYFTYFGLCFLGVGSFIFRLYCPREIADEPNIDRYVVNAPSNNAPVIAKDDFRRVLSIRFSDDDQYSHGGSPDFPDDLHGDFHALMQELYGKVTDDAVDAEMPEVMMASGYLDFTQLARAIWMNIRAHWVYTMPFYEAAPQLARDIAFTKYRFLDHTRFKTRLLILLIYFIGFGLLIKPTIHATILLSMGWMFGW